MTLHRVGYSLPHGKWTDAEIEMALRHNVHRFAVDLNKPSQHIKTRTLFRGCWFSGTAGKEQHEQRTTAHNSAGIAEQAERPGE
ncbi:unnamed protein product [Leptidea sinapis]|uniref:Uncharacterized protein n=1 Tax=Leptidea sinapis TaxID=189913 RepID=A0A5E4PS38_9NEOP|nr:unnamed protein product [Leptidea sinapis]